MALTDITVSLPRESYTKKPRKRGIFVLDYCLSLRLRHMRKHALNGLEAGQLEGQFKRHEIHLS